MTIAQAGIDPGVEWKQRRQQIRQQVHNAHLRDEFKSLCSLGLSRQLAPAFDCDAKAD
jgi:hypothetical protein